VRATARDLLRHDMRFAEDLHRVDGDLSAPAPVGDRRTHQKDAPAGGGGWGRVGIR